MNCATQIRADNAQGAARVLAGDDVLVLAGARSAVLQHSRDAAGEPLLTLYVGTHEIAWDNPRHFVFGRALAAGKALRADEVSAWGELGWDEAAPMLADLLDGGVLVRSGACPVDGDRHDNRPMPSPLPPAPMDRARSWMDTDAPLMPDLAGRPLDLAWLEVAVPVFRTAHLFLDRDQRHVGEANAFPAAARTEMPTEWRGCPYAGNRYQPDRPMNMTALKAMRVHWRQMMGLLGPIREAYFARFPEARAGWTVAHVERLAVCVLALPSYLLLNCAAPVENGTLHPALSNLFRVTDGLRMTMHAMLFVPAFEEMRRPDDAVSADEILAYAERNYLFHSDHGVCAGPRFMVEDFLAVLLDGTAPRSGFDAEMDPELAEALGEIGPAIDYGLGGLQTFGTVFALWPAMARCYEWLHALLAGEGGRGLPGAAAVAERFAGHSAALNRRSFLGSEEWRVHREAVYDDMHEACGRGLGLTASAPLSQLVDAGEARVPDASRAALVDAVAEGLGGESSALAEAFADEVLDFLLRGQRIVGLAQANQQRLAEVLARPAPAAVLTLADANLYNVLQGEDLRSVPFLPNELADLFGVSIRVEADAIHIAREASRPSAIRRPPIPANTRAPARFRKGT